MPILLVSRLTLNYLAVYIKSLGKSFGMPCASPTIGRNSVWDKQVHGYVPLSQQKESPVSLWDKFIFLKAPHLRLQTSGLMVMGHLATPSKDQGVKTVETTRIKHMEVEQATQLFHNDPIA